MMIGGSASAGVFDICRSSSTSCSSCLSDFSIERRKSEGSSMAIGVFASRACAADTFDTSTWVVIFAGAYHQGKCNHIKEKLTSLQLSLTIALGFSLRGVNYIIPST